jgi:hypothetical protein
MAPLSTKEKLKFLQAYMLKWHQEWRQAHPSNISGFRIGKKFSKGKESRNYAIIFQVKKKKHLSKLAPENQIPASLKIRFPDKKTRIIQTDIEETGGFSFHQGITGAVRSHNSTGFGSAGLFVTDDDNNVFLITNYHVVAGDFIKKNKFYYRRPAEQTTNDVKITLPDNTIMNGRFETGTISHEVDVSFTEVFIEPGIELNRLPDDNRISGRLSGRGIPASMIGKNIRVYSFYNKSGAGAKIKSNSSVLYTANDAVYFQDIIQISPKVTQGGDSGGAVLTESNAIVGIIVGGDSSYSYAIPFYKINDFKNVYLP